MPLNWTGKKEKRKGAFRGTRLGGLQGVGHVVEVCLEGCYIGENVM